MNLLLLIQAPGILQGIILSLVLFSIKNGNFKANKFLAICLFFLSVSMFLHVFAEHLSVINFIKHELIVNLISLLYGPFLYFYIRTLTLQTFKFQKRSFLHFIPFFILLISSYILYVLFRDLYSLILYIIKITTFIHVFLYLIYLFILLKRYSNKIKESFSTLDKINLNWLKYLLIIFIIIWISAVISESFLIISWDYFWMLVSILMYIIGYFALWQPEIFKIEVKDEVLIKDNKYEKSSLTFEMAEKYFIKLKELMEKEKPYLKAGLTLPDLAKMLNISTHHLSQLLNQKSKQNFFEFINQYRIEEAKRLIKNLQYKNIKIVEIGYEVGYNSISSFNNAFKKNTSLTPSIYRERFYLKKL